MVTGFYAALAAAASVFIGILTALLASNLSNLNAQRERIKRRIGAIDARLENLQEQHDQFKGTFEAIREEQESRERRDRAEEQVDEFIEGYVGTDFNIPPDELTTDRLRNEFSEFIDEDLNEEHHEVLQARFEDVQEALASTSAGLFGIPEAPPLDLTDPAITATNRQINHQWRMHEQERYNRNYRRWVQTMTEIRSLQDERERLAERYSSLDPSRIRGSLQATVVTIGLSVGVPLLAYLLRVSGVSFLQTLQPWVEPTVIFGIWIFGLVYVFKHLRDQVNEEADDLPEESDITLDGETE